MNKEIVVMSNSSINLIKIFDSNNNKLVEEYINNKYIFNGKENNVYKILISSSNNSIYSSFYLNCNDNSKYIFDLRKTHKIFISLTDQNYEGLKIDKGEIILWQNLIV